MDTRHGPDPLAQARVLGAAIAAAADAIESTRRIPAPLLAQLHDARLTRMLLPRSAGGDQVEPGTYVLTIEEIARHDASVAWNVFVANSAALIAAFLEPGVARTIFADPRALVAWGPPNAARATAVADGYRLAGTWDFASGCRNATWMGAHCQVVEPDGALAPQPPRPPGHPHLLVPRRAGDAARHLEHHRPARHGLRFLQRRRPVRARSLQHHARGAAAAPRAGPLYAFTMQGLYAVGVAGVALGIARAMLDEFMGLAMRKTPRALGRLADNAVIQADVARAEARLGAARAYLLDTLAAIYAHADDVEPIDLADRARVRLACTNAIHGALEVADFTYKAAGVDAIFPGSPFERRFRDIHTLSQQIQSRTAHFEAVGEILLGKTPAMFF